MSDNIDIYVLYLNETITKDRIRSIYTDILNDHPNVSFSLPFDDMVEFSYDVNSYFGNDRFLTWGDIRFEDLVTIQITNCDLGDVEGFQNYPPHVRGGKRQLRIHFKSGIGINYTIMDEPELGFRILSLLSTIAKHSNPFFGLFLWGMWYDNELIPHVVKGVDYLETLLRDSGGWATFYCDKELASAIGYDDLDQWADLRTPVDGMGYFIERGDVPLQGYNTEDDPDIAKIRDRIYLENMHPRFIERLEKEYEVKVDPTKIRHIGELGIEYYPYGSKGPSR